LTQTRASARKNLHLPVPLPDLAIVEHEGQWHIERISSELAALLGYSAESLRGQSLQVLPPALPSLFDLAAEALDGQGIEDIHVRIGREEGATTLAAVVRPGGLSADDSGRRVLFFFRPLRTAQEQEPRYAYGMVGASPGMREVFRKIHIYGQSDAPVVVTGETGSGKELVARALHDESARRGGPYVAMNCAAVAEDLLESELFGHEKGAFTGALRTHRGRFERADGGSLFLDEIGDMPLHTQSKLLRVLEEGRLERVGGEHERTVDVRVLCATNIPLERAVGQGRFRSDLYHRLAVLRIHIPPLRERSEDIPHLVDHFLTLFNRKYGRQVKRLTPEALALLQSYLWPGNIRELRNVLERVYVESRAEVVGARAFTEWVRERRDFAPGNWDLEAAERRYQGNSRIITGYPAGGSAGALSPVVAPPVFDAEILGQGRRHSTRPAELDADEIRRAFKAAQGNLAGAARLLGVHRATLYRYMHKLGLSREELEA